MRLYNWLRSGMLLWQKSVERDINIHANFLTVYTVIMLLGATGLFLNAARLICSFSVTALVGAFCGFVAFGVGVVGVCVFMKKQ